MTLQAYPIQPALARLVIFLLLIHTCFTFELELLEPQTFNKATSIFKDGQLQSQYNDTEYNRILTCTNGQLTVIQFEKKLQLSKALIKIKYLGVDMKKANVTILGEYNLPIPVLHEIETESGVMVFTSGCLGNETNITNYFNKIDIAIKVDQNDHNFSFLLGCDKGGRNKKFEVGYIVITAINAAITIGVALHSRIWSLRYLGRPLSIQLKWHRFLIIELIILVLGVVLYFYAADQFKNANNLLKYLGLVLAYFFSFICCDQILFLVRKFKQEVYKYIRICDIISFVISSAIFALGFITDSWIYYDLLALSICVGAIKLLRFSTMQQAYISLAISVGFVSMVSIVFHFLLTRSYNDYGSELSSPLFIAIPDLVTELYKKCSWLPVIDVILPGVLLSFLRTYDQNYNTGWGGVYTVIGNVSFITGTILWVLLEAVYPYSIPFSLVTYLFLGFSIFLMSYKRNEFKTLWSGQFNGANNQIRTSLIIDDTSEGNRQSFGKMITPDLIDSIKYYEEQGQNDSNQDKKQTGSNRGSK